MEAEGKGCELVFASLLALSCLVGNVFGVSTYGNDSSSIVKSLPGFTGELSFYLQMGQLYIEVGDDEEVHMFYYFIESQGNSSHDPLLMWVDGAPVPLASPASSSEAVADFDARNYSGFLPILHLNPFTCTWSINILYLDGPVGAGFSYSETQEGYYVDDCENSPKTYEFLRKNWFCFDTTDQNYNHMMCVVWENDDDVQAALNVRPVSIQHYLTIFSDGGPIHVICILDLNRGLRSIGSTATALWHTVTSVVDYQRNFSKSDLRALISSGDHDMPIPHMATQKWINTPEYDIGREMEIMVCGQSNCRVYEEVRNDEFSLTFATTKGAGHFAAEYKVKEGSMMIDRWISCYLL